MSLSQLYADYLTSLKEEKERDQYRLFASDVGKCPRQVAYRLSNAEKNMVLDQTKWNKTIMFDLAEHVEARLAEALRKEGTLIVYQPELPLEEAGWWNWGGRADIVADYGGRRVIEVKTVHPSAFRYDLDYPWYHMQAKLYDVLLKDPYQLDAPPLVAIFDRGGTNTGVEQVVELTNEDILDEMAMLDGVRHVLMEQEELPDRLPRVLKEREYGKVIKQEADGRCNYCDYSQTCNPNTSTNVWAKREDKSMPYVPTKKADTKVLMGFIDSLIAKYTGGAQ